MSESPKFSRREFTVQSALAVLAGTTITVTGCGGDPPMGPTSAGGVTTNTLGIVSANHGHTAMITSAQLTAGNALSLNIRGTASHSHSLELTMAELQLIAAGTRLLKESSTNESHSHTVTFNIISASTY